MIHPSYNELCEAINEGEPEDKPVIASRYSLCLATAKRARQLIDGAEPMVTPKSNKSLSIAVDEIYNGKVKILGEEDSFKEYEENILIEEIIE